MKNHDSINAKLLVLAQFSILVFLYFRIGVFSNVFMVQLFQYALLLIALLSFFEFRKSKFNISPLPRKNTTLITTGIYRYVRHPMYFVLLTIFVPQLIYSRDIASLIVWAVLFLVLGQKIKIEEKLLEKLFPQYSKYRSKTKKLIPWVY